MPRSSKHSRNSRTWPRFTLGPLEAEVMEILWNSAECSVRQVTERLERKVAYTTVSTTMDRLFRNSLVRRKMSDRVFLYCPRVTPEQWQKLAARDVVTRFLARPNASRERLVFCLREAIDEFGSRGRAKKDQRESSRAAYPPNRI
jgi:predicted transcriptional regulator